MDRYLESLGILFDLPIALTLKFLEFDYLFAEMPLDLLLVKLAIGDQQFPDVIVSFLDLFFPLTGLSLALF